MEKPLAKIEDMSDPSRPQISTTPHMDTSH